MGERLKKRNIGAGLLAHVSASRREPRINRNRFNREGFAFPVFSLTNPSDSAKIIKCLIIT